MTSFWLFLSILFVISKCHIRLINPSPRSNANNLDSGGFCGNVNRNGNQEITTYNAGQTIQVRWQEQVAHHPGSEYRIALSLNGTDTGFDSCILLNHIPQHTFGNTRTLEATVTLPNVNCQYCALQVIQFLPRDNGGCCTWMENGDNSCQGTSYRSCANVVLQGASKQRHEISQCNQPDSWDYRLAGACDIYRYSESRVHWLAGQGNNNVGDLIINTGREQDDVTDHCPGSNTLCTGIIITQTDKPNGFDNVLGIVPFSAGGSMTTGGIIAIILLIVLVLVISLTIIIVKRKQSSTEPSNSVQNNI